LVLEGGAMEALGRMHELSGLLLPLYEASQALSIAKFQDFALDLVKPFLRFNSGLWSGGALSTCVCGVRADAVHLHNQGLEVLSAYAEVMKQDSAVSMLKRNGGGTISFNARSLFAGAELSGIRDYTRRFEHENTTVVCSVNTASQFINWISFYRAAATDEFSGDETERAAIISAHLFKSVELNRRAHLTRLMGARSQSKRSLGICDSRGNLHYMEQGFEDIALLEWNRCDTNRRFPEDVVTELLGAGFYLGRAITLYARQDAGLVFLTIRPREGADALSKREMQIVQEISRGKSYKQIARALALSPATVRTHIQRIHRKLSTRNTAQLLAAVNMTTDEERTMKSLS
jgi:DNA-binding CsgD family transcriptional regulator